MPIPSASASLPVRTQSTPSAAAAFEVSMLLIRACACGDITTTPWHWRGSAMSST